MTLQESARFLASRGRLQEAERCLLVVAAANNVPLQEGFLTGASAEEGGEVNELSREPHAEEAQMPLLKSLQLLRRWPVGASTLGLMILCMVCNFAYYGLIFAL